MPNKTKYRSHETIRAEEMRRRAQENELRKNKKPIFNNDQFTQLKIVSKNKNEK